MLLFILLAVLPSPEELRKLPDVADVSVHNPSGERKLVHICDWHWISREAFLLDGGEADEYDAFLNQVETVQQEQMKALRALGVKKVYMEGESEKTIVRFRERVKTLKELRLPTSDSPVDQLVRELYREDLLQIGAAGRLFLSGEIDEVAPLEDHQAWRAANPAKNGKVEFNEEANKRREQVMVAKIAKEKEAVIVLGSEHQLSKLLPKDVAYTRVVVKSVKRLTIQQSN
jgi:hypothetical protein